MPRRSEDYKQARRAEIVDAARAAATRKGLGQLTMRDIADEAGVSMGAITNYFERREQIVAEAAARGAEARKAWLAALRTHPEPTLALAQGLAELAADGSLELSLVVEATHDPALAKVVHEATQATLRDVAALLDQEGIDAREARTRAGKALACAYGLAALNLAGGSVPKRRAVLMIRHALEEA